MAVTIGGSGSSASRLLGRGDALLLNASQASRYGVAVSWNCIAGGADLDLQAVVVNENGEVIDAVFHNNPVILRAALAQSGDDIADDKAVFDELIWVELGRVPDHVRLIFFVVGAYAGSMVNVVNSFIHVLEDVVDREIAHFPLGRTKSEVGVVAMLERRAYDNTDPSWRFLKYEKFASKGRHFMDIIEPIIGDLIRQMIVDAPRRQKVAFTLQKGSVLHLPEALAAKWVFVSLAWDLAPQVIGDNGADLRVSAVFFDKSGSELGALDEDSDEVFGLRHSGGGLTGAGIAADLEAIPRTVLQIFIVGNLMSPARTMDMVVNPVCRVVDSKGTELASSDLCFDSNQSGLILARLFREPGETSWAFQILGAQSSGRRWPDSVKEMRRLFEKAPREFRALGPGPQDPGAQRPLAPEVPEDDDPRPPDPEGGRRNWRDIVDFREHGCAEVDFVRK